MSAPITQPKEINFKTLDLNEAKEIFARENGKFKHHLFVKGDQLFYKARDEKYDFKEYVRRFFGRSESSVKVVAEHLKKTYTTYPKTNQIPEYQDIQTNLIRDVFNKVFDKQQEKYKRWSWQRPCTVFDIETSTSNNLKQDLQKIKNCFATYEPETRAQAFTAVENLKNKLSEFPALVRTSFDLEIARVATNCFEAVKTFHYILECINEVLAVVDDLKTKSRFTLTLEQLLDDKFAEPVPITDIVLNTHAANFQSQITEYSQKARSVNNCIRYFYNVKHGRPQTPFLMGHLDEESKAQFSKLDKEYNATSKIAELEPQSHFTLTLQQLVDENFEAPPALSPIYVDDKLPEDLKTQLKTVQNKAIAVNTLLRDFHQIKQAKPNELPELNQDQLKVLDKETEDRVNALAEDYGKYRYSIQIAFQLKEKSTKELLEKHSFEDNRILLANAKLANSVLTQLGYPEMAPTQETIDALEQAIRKREEQQQQHCKDLTKNERTIEASIYSYNDKSAQEYLATLAEGSKEHTELKDVLEVYQKAKVKHLEMIIEKIGNQIPGMIFLAMTGSYVHKNEYLNERSLLSNLETGSLLHKQLEANLKAYDRVYKDIPHFKTLSEAMKPTMQQPANEALFNQVFNVFDMISKDPENHPELRERLDRSKHPKDSDNLMNFVSDQFSKISSLLKTVAFAEDGRIFISQANRTSDLVHKCSQWGEFRVKLFDLQKANEFDDSFTFDNYYKICKLCEPFSKSMS